jgi:hypothetical protein
VTGADEDGFTDSHLTEALAEEGTKGYKIKI